MKKARYNDILIIFSVLLGISFLYCPCSVLIPFMLRLAIAFLAMLVVPGYLITELFYPGEFELPEKAPLWVGISIAYMVLPGMVGYLFGLRMEIFIWFIFMSGLVFLFLKKTKDNPNRESPHAGEGTLFILLLGSLVSLVVFGLGFWTEGDSVFHVAFIRKLAENVFISPFNGQFAVNKVDPAYGYNIWYLALGSIARISGLDTITVWHYMSGFLMLPSMLAVFLLGKILFKNRRIALFSVIAFLLFYGYNNKMGGKVGGEFKALVFPNHISLYLIVPVALYFMLKCLDDKKTSSLVLCSLVGFTSITIHMNAWVIFLLFLISFMFLDFMARKDMERTGRLLRVSGLAILLSGIFLCLKLNAILAFLHPYTKRDAIRFSDNLYIVSPRQSLGPEYMVALLLVVAGIIYIIKRKEKLKDYQAFLIAGTLTPVLIIFNPLLAPLAARLITYTFMHRLWSMIPISFIYGIAIYAIAEEIKKKLPLKNGTVAITLSVFLLVAGGVKSNIFSLKLDYSNYIPELSSILKKYIPAKSIVCSDVWTSTHIPQYSNNYTVVVQSKHKSPVIDYRKHHAETKRFFEFGSGIGETMDYLSRHAVDYILVNENPHPLSWFVNDISFKFESLPLLFSRVYAGKGYIIYGVRRDIGIDGFRKELRKRKEESLEKTRLLYNKGEIMNAFAEIKTARFLFSNTMEIKSLHEALRLELRKSDSPLADAALLSNNTTVESSSEFFPEPNGAEAAIDGAEKYDKDDYAAAGHNALPNWFVLDFNQERNIRQFEIKWLNNETRGLDFRIEYFDGKEWRLAREEKGWSGNDCGIYNFKLPAPVKAHKVKLSLTKAAGQNRMLISRFSVDYSALKEGKNAI